MILLCDLISHYLAIFYQIYIYLLPYSYQLPNILDLIFLLQNIILIKKYAYLYYWPSSYFNSNLTNISLLGLIFLRSKTIKELDYITKLSN